MDQPKMIYDKGAYRLPHNDIWNVPESVDDVRGELKTWGMWGIPVSYKALCIDGEHNVYGVRTLTNVKQSGYELEGRVSINGKRYRGFTSSRLMLNASNKLVSVAVIYACMNQPEGIKKIRKRLEHLRAELKGECISYDELHELQSLAKYIDPEDVELLEAAGVPERNREEKQ